MVATLNCLDQHATWNDPYFPHFQWEFDAQSNNLISFHACDTQGKLHHNFTSKDGNFNYQLT